MTSPDQPIVPPPTAPVAARPYFDRRDWIVLGGLAVTIVAAFIVAVAVAGHARKASDDVRVIGCTGTGTSGLRTMEATLGVVNTGSRASNYRISVAFTSRDGGHQYDTATAIVRDLQPGQGATPKAVAFTSEYVPSDLRCEVLRVSRL